MKSYFLFLLGTSNFLTHQNMLHIKPEFYGWYFNSSFFSYQKHQKLMQQKCCQFRMQPTQHTQSVCQVALYCAQAWLYPSTLPHWPACILKFHVCAGLGQDVLFLLPFVLKKALTQHNGVGNITGRLAYLVSFSWHTVIYLACMQFKWHTCFTDFMSKLHQSLCSSTSWTESGRATKQSYSSNQLGFGGQMCSGTVWIT